MQVTEFSAYMQRLENTSKRLEITGILLELLNKLSPAEVEAGVYLSLGGLKAPYENPKFNIGLIKASSTTPSPDREILGT